MSNEEDRERDILGMASDIRFVDGGHSLGASALAEELVDLGYGKRTPAPVSDVQALIDEARAFIGGHYRADYPTTFSLLDRLADALEAALAVSTPQDTEWEYDAGYEADNGIEMRWFSMNAGAFTIREAAEWEVERFADPQIRLVRRTRPGPWEPVPTDGVSE